MNSQFVPFPLDSVLSPILNSPEWLISIVIKNGGVGHAPNPPFAHGYAWASFHFELCEGHSEGEMFTGVGGGFLFNMLRLGTVKE